MDKIAELKQLVGEDVAGEILSTSEKLTHRAKRLGLKTKEADMPKNDFAEFLAAYEAYKAFNAEAGEVAQFDDEVLYEEPAAEPVVEETVKMDTGMIEKAVMRAVKAAFLEMQGEEEEDEKGKELATIKEANAQLLKTVKELSERVAALEQPIAPAFTGGNRVTENPQTTAKALGASVAGAADVLDLLGGLQ